MKIPATREEAIAAIVELDVAKWGEVERDASKRKHEALSYGRALNRLAHRPEYGYGDHAPDLVAAAKKAMTPDDWSELQKGG